MKLIFINIAVSLVISILCMLYIFNCGDVLLGNSWLNRDRMEYVGKPWKDVEQELHDKGFYYMGYCSSFSPYKPKEYCHLYCKESVLNTKKYLILYIDQEENIEPKYVTYAHYLFQCPSYGLAVWGYTSCPKSDFFTRPRGFTKEFTPAVPFYCDPCIKALDSDLWLDR